jgi:hypothetical protein
MTYSTLQPFSKNLKLNNSRHFQIEQEKKAWVLVDGQRANLLKPETIEEI